jgi:hypothetical protein
MLTRKFATFLPVFIFSSSNDADESFSATPLIDANRSAAKEVLSSGIPAIVLKPGLYLENSQVPFFVPHLANGILDYPSMKADQPISWVHTGIRRYSLWRALISPN